jgi:hypothetical protein
MFDMLSAEGWVLDGLTTQAASMAMPLPDGVNLTPPMTFDRRLGQVNA